MTRRLLVAAGLLAAAVAAALALRPLLDRGDESISGPPDQPDRAGDGASKDAVDGRPTTSTGNRTTGTPGGIRYGWRVGDAYRYDFSYRHQVRIRQGTPMPDGEGSSGTPDAEQSASFGIRGRLTLSVHAAVPEGRLVGWRFDGIEMTGSAGDSVFGEEHMKEAAARLEVEALSVVAPSGELRTLRLAPPTRAEDVNQIKSVLAAFRIVLGEPGASEWSTSEEDLLGTYTGIHRRIPAEEEGLAGIEKTKVYQTIHEVAGRTGSMQVESDVLVRAWLRLETGVLERVEGEESVALSGEEAAFRIATRIESSFRLVETASGTGDDGRVADHEGWKAWDGFGPAEAAAIHERQKESDERALAASLSLDEVLHDVENGGKDRFMDLTVLLRHDETARARALDTLRAGGAGEKVESALIGALGKAGTAPAQEVLLEVASDGGVPPETRVSALTAVALVETPRPDLTVRLRTLVEGSAPTDRVALAALELLGAVGRPSRRPVEAEVLAFLEASLERSDDTTWKGAALRGLGNAGDPRSFDLVAAHTTNETPEVRAAAYLALRKMPREKALPLLEKAVFDDPSEVARAAAAAAIDAME